MTLDTLLELWIASVRRFRVVSSGIGVRMVLGVGRWSGVLLGFRLLGLRAVWAACPGVSLIRTRTFS